VESNKEIESLIQNIECQDGIFSPEDKESLLKAFKEEKVSLLNKSNEVKKTLNTDELLKTFNKEKK